MQSIIEAQKILMREVIEGISSNYLAEEFLEPVDWQGLWLYDYLKIITNPMDLTTLKKKIDSYENLDQFLLDLFLIWDNCKKYNKFGTVKILNKT